MCSVWAYSRRPAAHTHPFELGLYCAFASSTATTAQCGGKCGIAQNFGQPLDLRLAR